MTVTNIAKDAEALTMTITSEFTANADQVWNLWEDPAKLSQWWGPPTYPATFEPYTLAAGETFGYYMTSPEGDKYPGWFRITQVDAPKYLEFDEGFAHGDGTPDEGMPTSIIRVTIEELASEGTRMTITVHFSSADAMQQLLTMGMQEGLAGAMGQIDAILAA